MLFYVNFMGIEKSTATVTPILQRISILIYYNNFHCNQSIGKSGLSLIASNKEAINSSFLPLR